MPIKINRPLYWAGCTHAIDPYPSSPCGEQILAKASWLNFGMYFKGFGGWILLIHVWKKQLPNLKPICLQIHIWGSVTSGSLFLTLLSHPWLPSTWKDAYWDGSMTATHLRMNYGTKAGLRLKLLWKVFILDMSLTASLFCHLAIGYMYTVYVNT